MQEYGIWTENDGGFTESQLYSMEEAEDRLAEIIAGGETEEDRDELREDLSIEELCPEHRDNQKDGCEDCLSEYEEEESG